MFSRPLIRLAASLKPTQLRQSLTFRVSSYNFSSSAKVVDPPKGAIPEEEWDPNKFENPLVKPGKEKIVGSWLFLSAGTVLFMILIGGYTRLKSAGLSMVTWKPIQNTYPKNEAEWQKEFENYKQFPEYQIANKDMNLAGFKRIFFIEYFHRLFGNITGLVFALPFATFYGLQWIKPALSKRLVLALGLGGLQGLIGWWMVKSGLKEKPEYQARPRVSTYRLFVHLMTAVSLYSFLVWTGLSVIRKPQELLLTASNFKGMRKVWLPIHFAMLSVGLTIMAGATIAGIDAGKVFNDWPFMNGE